MRLLVFAREPVPGRVKTRLTPSLSPAAAAGVYAYLLERTMLLAAEARARTVVERVECWCEPTSERPYFVALGRRFGVDLRDQPAGDLGQRMHQALHQALAEGDRALLVGSDCPGLGLDTLARGAQALQEHDAVFVPAVDGGYALVGLSRPVDCFSAIEWGTSAVMGQTRSRLADLRVRWRELEPVVDIDTAADLEAWLRTDSAAERDLAGVLARPAEEH
jgi:rSAM/selenodomain-associated transferase 1